jgi:hypothetical protein
MTSALYPYPIKRTNIPIAAYIIHCTPYSCQTIVAQRRVSSIIRVNKEILQKIRGLYILEKQSNVFFPCFLYNPTSFILHFRRMRNLSKVKILAGC